MPFRPGPGVGGHCIPCDPHYLLWQLRGRHVLPALTTQAMAAIATRPRRVVERAGQVLGDAGRSVAGSRVLVVGVAYKPRVADVRESPAVEILHALAEAGARVGFVDPMVERLRLPSGRTLTGTHRLAAADWDLAVVHTVHPGWDLAWLGEYPLVLDASYQLTGIPQRAVP